MKTLAELKKMLLGPSDLNATFNYFFDIMDSRSLVNDGSLTKHEIKRNAELKSLIACVEDILTQFMHEKIKLNTPLLTWVKHEKFYHGFAQVHCSSLPVTILYFSDIKVGVCALVQQAYHTEYFRFSLINKSLTETTNIH